MRGKASGRCWVLVPQQFLVVGVPAGLNPVGDALGTCAHGRPCCDDAISRAPPTHTLTVWPPAPALAPVPPTSWTSHQQRLASSWAGPGQCPEREQNGTAGATEAHGVVAVPVQSHVVPQPSCPTPVVPGPVCPTVSPHPRAGLRCYNASPAARGWAQGTGEVEDATAGGQAITASALGNALPAQTQPGLVGLGLGMELRRPLPAGPRRGASAAAPAAPVGTCQETRDHEEKRTPNGC